MASMETDKPRRAAGRHPAAALRFAKMTTDARSLASTGYAQARGKAQDSAEKMWGEVRRQAHNVTQEIEERPFASALASFATGLLLGMLLNSRRG